MVGKNKTYEHEGSDLSGLSGVSASSRVSSISRRAAVAANAYSKTIVKVVSGHQGRMEFEELKKSEETRRKLLDRTKEPSWKVLFSFQGTFFPVLLRKPLLWMSLAIYICIRIYARVGLPDYVPTIDVSLVNSIGALMAFFLVFFHVELSNRYKAMHLRSVMAKGFLYDITLWVCSLLPYEDALLITRLMNSAHALGYIGVSETYTMTNFFLPLNKEEKWLTQGELTSLLARTDPEVGFSSCLLLMSWTMDVITKAMDRGALNPSVSRTFHVKLTDFRQAMDIIHGLEDQPILFMYIHFVIFISAIYLPIFSLSVAFQIGIEEEDFHWTNDIVGAIIVVLQCMFVIGVRVLAQQQLDPYGDDNEDLSVLTYVMNGFSETMMLVDDRVPPGVVAKQESVVPDAVPPEIPEETTLKM